MIVWRVMSKKMEYWKIGRMDNKTDLS